MSKLIGMLSSLVLYLCFGTILAQGVAFAYLWSKGYLSHEKLSEIDAVMRDFTPAEVKSAQLAKLEAPVPTVEEVARSRALAQRDIELRDQALRQRADQIQTERAKLGDEIARLKQLKSGFETELTQLHDTTVGASADNARIVLENLKPKQAKDQLLRMIDAGEMAAATKLLDAMPVSKRAKVCTEFKSDEDAKKLAEMLKRIREGEPEIQVIDSAKNKLQNATAPKPST